MIGSEFLSAFHWRHFLGLAHLGEKELSNVSEYSWNMQISWAIKTKWKDKLLLRPTMTIRTETEINSAFYCSIEDTPVHAQKNHPVGDLYGNVKGIRLVNVQLWVGKIRTNPGSKFSNRGVVAISTFFSQVLIRIVAQSLRATCRVASWLRSPMQVSTINVSRVVWRRKTKSRLKALPDQ